MQINFTKVVHFTQLIKAGGRLREFNFRKLRQLEEEIFSVDTVDDRGNRILFYMHKDNNNSNWVITPQPLPAWVIENESKLNEEILNELNRH
ncbi:MAG: hypothetical protein ACSLE0_05025 [Chitinophagaceae bacterium]